MVSFPPSDLQDLRLDSLVKIKISTLFLSLDNEGARSYIAVGEWNSKEKLKECSQGTS